MGAVAVIGEPGRVQGYALAGTTVLPAVGAEAVLRAWAALDPGTSLVILTSAAAGFLVGELKADDPLTVVMPS